MPHIGIPTTFTVTHVFTSVCAYVRYCKIICARANEGSITYRRFCAVETASYKEKKRVEYIFVRMWMV